MRLLVIADDFTGSIDTGVQLAKLGIATTVLTCEDDRPRPELSGCSEAAVVVDTESRHLSSEEAYRRVFQIAAAGKQAGFDSVYKKTDSTLRGNIGAELAATIVASGASRMIFVPAFPAMGRTTQNGVQYVNGVPLAETEFARDLFNPVKSSRVSEIIGMQTGFPVREFSDETLGSEREKPHILVANASTKEDLERIGRKIVQAGQESCLGGCAGFAEVLSGMIRIERGRICLPPNGKGRLLICGSIHPMAEKQCGNAICQCGYEPFILEPEQLLGQREIDGEELEQWRAKLLDGGKVLLRPRGGDDTVRRTNRIGAEAGLSELDVSRKIAYRFGSVAARLLDEPFSGTLIVFGGDTLHGLSRPLGIGSISPVSEIAPGIAISLAEMEKRRIYLVSKAGAFGETDVVSGIDEYLTRMENTTAGTEGK
ncbi:MAG: four-carbon acid sugar kinase family protein [Eubacteriales bacterium]|nr:four-carbon acid sugar kinase family protein [Eubacteriales bacterium]